MPCSDEMALALHLASDMAAQMPVVIQHARQQLICGKVPSQGTITRYNS